MSYTLDELCHIEKGKIGITKAVDGEYPLVTTGEDFGTHNEYHFEGPAVCVPLVSSTGHGHASIKRLHYVEGKFACGNILAVLIPKDPSKLSAKFLYAYLTSHKEEKLVRKMKGAANVSLTLTNLKKVKIDDLPSYSDQVKLTRRFFQLNSKFGRVEEKLELFDQFTEKFTKKLLNKLLIREEFDFVELGSQCKKIGSGSTPRGAEYKSEGIPFIRSQNVYNSGLNLDDVVFIDKETNKKLKSTIVQKDDLLLNITGGSIGRCSIFDCEYELANVNQHVSIIRSNSNVDSRFLHLIIMSPYFQKMIFRNTTGAGRQGLPKYKLEKFKIPLPSMKKQLDFVKRFESVQKKLYEIEAKSKERIELFSKLNSVSVRE